MCLSDFVFSSHSGLGDRQSFCDNRTELTARMRGCKTGRGMKVSCNVNRMRKAYYLYSIPYDSENSQNAAFTD